MLRNCICTWTWFNSLTPGRFERNIWWWWLGYLVRNCPHLNATGPYRWSVDIQVLTWCCQATNHYTSQYWPSHHMASLGHNELIWRQVWKFPNNDETMIRLSYLYNGSHYIDKSMYPYIKMAPGGCFPNTETAKISFFSVKDNVNFFWCLKVLPKVSSIPAIETQLGLHICNRINTLTHLPLVTHICLSELGQH